MLPGRILFQISKPIILFSHAGGTLVSGDEKGKMFCWRNLEAIESVCFAALEGHNSSIARMAFSPGKHLCNL